LTPEAARASSPESRVKPGVKSPPRRGAQHGRVTLDEDRLPAGIVFRRLGPPAERSQAHDLLAAGGPAYRSPRLAGDEAWSGLWNLTASNGTALAAAAATLRMSAPVMEVRALGVRAGGHWAAMLARLVREVADGCRANGAEWMVAAGVEGEALGLLRHVGFGPAVGLDLPGRLAWLAREV
jgi:hypothetical protein